MNLEVGKYYKSRDGQKVGPIRESESIQGWFDYFGSKGFFNELGHSLSQLDPDLIAEWIDDPVTGTLRELNVQPGDCIGYKGSGVATWVVNEYGKLIGSSLAINEEYYPGGPKDYWDGFEVISRAKAENPTSPVITETVTTKRIVPGVYGLVRVYDETCESGHVCLKVGSDGYHWTTPELTAAIATITQIRDALTHNSAK